MAACPGRKLCEDDHDRIERRSLRVSRTGRGVPQQEPTEPCPQV
jgi:hypothetical protein